MIQTCLNLVEYANRCDIAFMRQDALPFINNHKSIHDITNNCKIFCFSTLLPQLFQFLNTKNFDNIILLSGDNDHSVNPNGCITSFPGENNVSVYMPTPPKCISKWYAQNAQVVNNFMIPLPIGLTPPWAAGEKIYNMQSIKNIIHPHERTELLNCNFTTNTNPIQRQEIKTIISNNLGIQNTVVHPTEYYSSLQKSKYAICPPGNGKDTHRVWECLYLGTIPIVEDSLMNRYFASLFPILVVERWSDLTESLLLNRYEELSSRNKNLNLLDVDMWFKYHNLENINNVI